MTALESMFESAPLWLLSLIFFIALMLASQLGRWLRKRAGEPADDAHTDSHVLTATLALLGLLIAFTFSLAINRYDERRQAVIAESNALSTAWLIAGLASGPEGEALRDSFRRYLDVRLRLPHAEDRGAVERQSQRLQAEIWQRLTATLPNVPVPIGATMVRVTTDVFDAAASRKAERDARIPGAVFDVVSLFALIAAGIVGFVLARTNERRQVVLSAILFLLLTLSLTLILDLDRPWSGSITISGQPMIDAGISMR